MKKAIIASLTLLFVQAAAFAQTPVVTNPDTDTKIEKKGGRKENKKDRKEEGGKKKGSAGDRAAQYSQELKSKLGLSDDQYQKVLAVNTECINRKDATKGNKDKSAKDEIKAYRQAEFQKIFTPQQLTTYQSLHKKGHDGDDHRKGDREDRGDKKGKGKGRGEGKPKEGDSKENK
ncbi:hypothetical protein LV89_02877 [Arcicella aurantiaca]|uniref:LTXXQ motif family protein n=1 Tax=Arcicella aurantiaca TaxID=591202 RepID=A0A316E4C8_9BACT|nr:hypothetical protein [Arcicella aurantiaca]PWK25251.1 hypothetical protein LV89_02877 [Arcicella aurantiaca]